MTTLLRLGGPRATRRESQDVRRNAFTVQSPFGMDPAALLLVEALPKEPRPAVPGQPVRALFGMDTEGAPALAASVLWPAADVSWFHFDAYVAAKVAGVFEDNCDHVPRSPRVVAGEDLPHGPAVPPFDVVALPFPCAGEALLMRDLLEAAHDTLRVGGRLVAATDRSGRALGQAIEAVFGHATPGPPSDRGAAFFAERRRAKPVRRDRSHVLSPEIVPAGGGPAVRMEIETRPGTFSHGSLDRGTRALLEWHVPAGETSVLDLGAGCGAVGIFAALRCPGARVGLVESNVRAAECARRNVGRNGLTGRAEVFVRADFEDIPPPSAIGAAGEGARDGARDGARGGAGDGGGDGAGDGGGDGARDGGGGGGAGGAGGVSGVRGVGGSPGSGWDLVLANPPYFGEFRIARSFAEAALRALRPGGRAAFVAKRGNASTGLLEVVREVFGRCVPFDSGEYVVVAATKG